MYTEQAIQKLEQEKKSVTGNREKAMVDCLKQMDNNTETKMKKAFFALEAECRKALEDLIHIQGVLEAMYQRRGAL